MFNILVEKIITKNFSTYLNFTFLCTLYICNTTLYSLYVGALYLMQRGEIAQNLPEILGKRRHVLIKSWGPLG